MDDSDPIRRRMVSLKDEELLRILGPDADDWQPEAQDLAREELQRRGVKIPDRDLLLAEDARLKEAERASEAAKANRSMLIGALLFIGGTAVTVVSYSAAASSPGGGTYVVAYGAIIGGLIQLLRGFAARTR